MNNLNLSYPAQIGKIIILNGIFLYSLQNQNKFTTVTNVIIIVYLYTIHESSRFF